MKRAPIEYQVIVVAIGHDDRVYRSYKNRKTALNGIAALTLRLDTGKEIIDGFSHAFVNEEWV